ncbi:uncharacterized protein LOC123272114 isoform X2 [Cotesia glomerata]|uniref:uncharacterized protein LOC123272114 isoform X2 n=1 Tax=Cotesia glomerata TaxID=32391 RepID=UPI001D02B2F4|nr:uncharacterized protein LOC123272114 isoform X2 [Cotesia glomerata]
MASLIQACALFFLVAICRAAPTMKPSAAELNNVYEGDTLAIKCTSNTDLQFFTVLDEPSKQSLSVMEVGITVGSYMRGIRKKASVGDSGWYGCANTGVKVDTSKHDQPDVTWAYVKIKSKKPSMEPAGKMLKLTEGDTLTLKCSSDQEMKFYLDLYRPEKATKSEEMATAVAGGRFTHTFEKKKVVPKDSGHYGCVNKDIEVTPENLMTRPEIRWLYVSVKPKKPAMEPSGTLNLKTGDKLSITCHSYEEMAFYTVLNNPNEQSMMTESESAVFEGAHTRTLEKKSVIPGDSGRYGCAYANVKVDTSRSDQPDVNWITVNVK